MRNLQKFLAMTLRNTQYLRDTHKSTEGEARAMAEEGGEDPCADIIWPHRAVWRRGLLAVPARRRKAQRWSPASCQFIVGEPSHTDRGKCGRPVSGKTAYCAQHRALCLLPPPEDEVL
jgi:hypothetical protein